MSHVDRAALIAEAMMDDRPPPRPPEWWRGAMFYEVYLRSFRDTEGDGLGDLRGVIEKLDYIRDLRVDGLWLSPFYIRDLRVDRLWLSPFYPSPQVDFGYDVTDFCAVDPTFGTMDDVHELLEGAHGRGLKVLMDFVPCHTSDQHPWFLESRQGRDNAKADWYIWADASFDGGPPNNWLSSFGGSAWHWEPRRSQYYYHPFLTCQPALNLRNREAREAMLSAMRFWLDRGVDGFRLDAVQCLACDPALRDNPPSPEEEPNVTIGGGPNNPFRRQLHIFDRDVPESIPVLEAMRDAVRDYLPERALIGELADVDSSRLAAKYTLRGRRLHAVYDFDLISAASDLERWREILRVREDYIASGWTMNVLTNHDSVRAVSSVTARAAERGMGDQAAKLLLLLQSTLRGGGIVFQGEELGLPQPGLDYDDLQDPWGKALWLDFPGRDGVRTPLPWAHEARNAGFSTSDRPWLPVPPEHVRLSVDRQEADGASVLQFFRALMEWRQSEDLLRTGCQRLHGNGPARLLSYDRFDGDRCLTLLVNLGMDGERMPWAAEGKPLAVAGSVTAPFEEGLWLPALSFAVIEA